MGLVAGWEHWQGGGRVGEFSESGMGAAGGGVAHRLLENDADAATPGVFDGLYGAVVEVAVPKTARERWTRNSWKVGLSMG